MKLFMDFIMFQNINRFVVTGFVESLFKFHCTMCNKTECRHVLMMKIFMQAQEKADKFIDRSPDKELTRLLFKYFCGVATDDRLNRGVESCQDLATNNEVSEQTFLSLCNIAKSLRDVRIELEELLTDDDVEITYDNETKELCLSSNLIK